MSEDLPQYRAGTPIAELKAHYYALFDQLRAVVAGAGKFGPKVQKRITRRTDDIAWELRKALKLQIMAELQKQKAEAPPARRARRS
jgi:hypothetical protein